MQSSPRKGTAAPHSSRRDTRVGFLAVLSLPLLASHAGHATTDQISSASMFAFELYSTSLGTWQSASCSWAGRTWEEQISVCCDAQRGTLALALLSQPGGQIDCVQAISARVLAGSVHMPPTACPISDPPVVLSSPYLSAAGPLQSRIHVCIEDLWRINGEVHKHCFRYAPDSLQFCEENILTSLAQSVRSGFIFTQLPFWRGCVLYCVLL